MRDPWLRCFATLLLGGIIGVYSLGSISWFVLVIFILGLFRLCLWRPGDSFSKEVRPELILLCVSIIVGFCFGQAGKDKVAEPLVLNSFKVVGELQDWSLEEDRAVGIIKITGTHEELPNAQDGFGDISPDYFRDRKYKLRVYYDSQGQLPPGWELVKPGDVLEFNAKLEQPKPPGTPGQFDYPLYNAVRGLSGWLTAKGQVSIIESGSPSTSWQIRNHVQDLWTIFPPDLTGLLKGILFGDTSGIPEEAGESYRVTGVYHVFSASGSNVGFLLFLCWNATIFVPSYLRVGVIIVILVIYAFLCGGNPPILRATLMAVFILLGRLGKDKVSRISSLRGLMMAATLLFVWQPLILKDIGFQLSFMATWGILVLGPRLEEVKFLARCPKPIRKALAMTWAAQIATLPLMIQAFHRISIIGFLANLLFLFVLGSIFELGIVAVFLSFIPELALPLFQVSFWLLEWVSKILGAMARIPLADVWVVNPGLLFWLCWYGWIIYWLLGKERVDFTLKVWWENGKRTWEKSIEKALRKSLGKPLDISLARLVLTKLSQQAGTDGANVGLNHKKVLAVIVILLFLWSPWNAPDVLRVTFIDVGQGDCILIEAPGKKRIMVDAGPKTNTFDAGKQIIVPYLLQRGIKSLDALILTHPHGDHVGGASAILETIPVDWVGIPEDGLDWFSLAASEDSLNKQEEFWGDGGVDWQLLKLLEQKRVEKLFRGDVLYLDSGITLTVIAPGKVLTGTKSDENNNSLVLRLENRQGQSVLLTGDMEEEEMAEIYSSGLEYGADVFKVPHHGSRYSLQEEILDQMEPLAVIIPVGKNSFGHPSTQVLYYWEERQVPIYRTDEDGTIQVILDGTRIEVLPGRW